MGYRAPFVFSLILVGVDLVLRLFIIEKHTALKYIRAGHYIPNFEAPGYVDPNKTIDPTKTIDSQKTVITSDLATRPTEPVATAPLQDEVDKSTSAAADESHATEIDKSASNATDESHADLKAKIPSHWIGLWHMLQSPRAMTTMALTFLNGFIVGALQDTGMTLYLEQEYGLTSFGAGLVFLGFVVPTFFASPLAGWVRRSCCVSRPSAGPPC